MKRIGIPLLVLLGMAVVGIYIYSLNETIKNLERMEMEGFEREQGLMKRIEQLEKELDNKDSYGGHVTTSPSLGSVPEKPYDKSLPTTAMVDIELLCPLCQGDGICINCSNWMHDPTSSCSVCGGTGYCTYCKGNKTIKYTIRNTVEEYNKKEMENYNAGSVLRQSIKGY